ncbi:MAG: radical SAM/SPASM domain-containing protein [archaeon]
MKNVTQAMLNKFVESFVQKTTMAPSTASFLIKNKATRKLIEPRLMKRIEEEIEKLPYSKAEKIDKVLYVKSLVKRGFDMFPEFSSATRKSIITSLVAKSFLDNIQTREEFRKKYGDAYPALVVISPTYRCNMVPICDGCYASGHAKRKDEEMSFELIDRFITDMEKEWNDNFFVITGGEPFVRTDMLKIYAKHPESIFMIYTNGTLLTKAMAKKLAKLGNAMPAISIEGLEKDTDSRRNAGIHKKVLQAMDNLREAGVAFGFSVTATPNNYKVLASDIFFKQVMDKGCTFGWSFICGPYGHNPTTDLMLTPKQRIEYRDALRTMREKYMFPIADFWNDGPLAHGCMAAGTKYFHLNAYGDIEPCAFAQFSAGNLQKDIYDKGLSISAIMDLPLFKAIREGQKKIKNPLRPCVVIDHPEILREAVRKTGAKPSGVGTDAIVKDKIASFLDNYAKGLEKETHEKAKKYV